MRKNIYKELFVVYILALVFAIVFHGNHGAWIDKILTASTFVFAIILGFSIANRKARMTSIRSLLRKDDSYFLIIYENAKIYGDDIRAKVQKALDEYLIVQIDYFLEDFDMATPKLIELYRLLLNIKVPKDFGEDRKKSMIDASNKLIENQKELNYWVKDKMMSFEWVSLITLLLIISFCMFSISDGSIVYIIVLPLILTALSSLMLTLRDLENLRWQEDRWIWNRLIDLFKELDLMPYIPKDIFKKRMSEDSLNLSGNYRMVEYPSPYPNMGDKKITIKSKH